MKSESVPILLIRPDKGSISEIICLTAERHGYNTINGIYIIISGNSYIACHFTLLLHVRIRVLRLLVTEFAKVNISNSFLICNDVHPGSCTIRNFICIPLVFIFSCYPGCCKGDQAGHHSFNSGVIGVVIFPVNHYFPMFTFLL